MGLDLIVSVISFVAFILAPMSYLRFRIKTMFRYGTVGYTELLKIEKLKTYYLTKVLIRQTFKIYWQLYQVCVIYLLYMRKTPYLL